MSGRVSGTWTGVRERVLALRAAPGASKVFGASWGKSGHGFELRPPLADADLLAAERVWGTTLPEEYRGFLLEVGGSGAGPDYGLFPLRLPDGEGTASGSGHLRRVFRPAAVMELLDAHEDAEPRRDAYADDEAYLRAFRAWDRRDDELRDELTDGALYISERGCAYYTLLAVTGPERGTVWDDVQAVGEGVLPVRRPGVERVTFAEWYLGWLAAAERQAWDEGAS
ncbi:SMI1/KNR4 family protein [Streptomyces sp. NA02950]|uniref:SMI1/KNR4 family protein n=1 Tax=Streptomyces sp. NA02950 TaxID=2742137 RepID=UPI00159105AF|nr:SMI1/KNR4 family protein [Streptomyces sp. NA02950]QKV92989.1 SMI1/KNR4 family protein [Streptomyces sp. NA02950]